jgi:hypothetical protein
MKCQEDFYVDYFYDKYKGRVAIGVGFGKNLSEIYPFVFENKKGESIGIIGMATLSAEKNKMVHIFHLSAFKTKSGNGSKMLRELCRQADKFKIILSLTPFYSPNGEDDHISSEHLADWYRNFGFIRETALNRNPQ